jgi:hypothetical protein
VVDAGSRLRQGATYVNLNRPGLGEFTAGGAMVAERTDYYIPKADVDYETWDLLLKRLQRQQSRLPAMPPPPEETSTEGPHAERRAGASNDTRARRPRSGRSGSDSGASRRTRGH